MIVWMFWTSKAYPLDTIIGPEWLQAIESTVYIPLVVWIFVGMFAIHCVFYLGMLNRINNYFDAMSSPLNFDKPISTVNGQLLPDPDGEFEQVRGRYVDCVSEMHRHSAQEKIRRIEARRAGRTYWESNVAHQYIPTYFNTNPVFCLRSRYLGMNVSGWKQVRDYLHLEEDVCFPFMRGSYPNLYKYAY